jgi:hypothetical protein
MGDKIVTGPVQVFVIGFDHFEASGQILAELRRVRKRGVIRLVDLLFVQKDGQGNISSSMHMTDLSEAERERLGAVAGGIIGLEMAGLAGAEAGAELGALQVAERDYGLSEDQLRDLADSIPCCYRLEPSWRPGLKPKPPSKRPKPSSMRRRWKWPRCWLTWSWWKKRL